MWSCKQNSTSSAIRSLPPGFLPAVPDTGPKCDFLHSVSALPAPGLHCKVPRYRPGVAACGRTVPVHSVPKAHSYLWPILSKIPVQLPPSPCHEPAADAVRSANPAVAVPSFSGIAAALWLFSDHRPKIQPVSCGGCGSSGSADPVHPADSPAPETPAAPVPAGLPE